MIGGVIQLEARLRLDSPMHIGSGRIGKSQALRQDGQNDMPEVDLTSLDAKGCPIIPGSSLKGCLRAAMLGHVDHGDFFGPEAGNKVLHSGLVVFWTAKSAPDTLENASAGQPFAAAELKDESNQSISTDPEKTGTYIDVRTAIDRGTGTVDEQKLFRRQMVAPGVEFLVRIGISLRKGLPVAEQACADVLDVLRGGISLGSENNMDQGKARLIADTVTVTLDDPVTNQNKTLDPQNQVPAKAVSSVQQLAQFELACDTLFIVNDASAKSKRRAAKEAEVSDKDRPPSLEALHGFGEEADVPRLPGSTLKGKLRSAAVWYARWHLNNQDHRDNPSLVYSAGDLNKLSRIERLFGIAGWRGLLSIQDIEFVSHKEWKVVSSVKMDRFSGAPYDNGLFSVKASVAPVFRVKLGLSKRQIDGRSDETAKLDSEFFEGFVHYLQSEGITLGMGGNRGLGWFNVRSVT